MGPIIATFESCTECGAGAVVAPIGGARLCRGCLDVAATAIEWCGNEMRKPPAAQPTSAVGVVPAKDPAELRKEIEGIIDSAVDDAFDQGRNGCYFSVERATDEVMTLLGHDAEQPERMRRKFRRAG